MIEFKTNYTEKSINITPDNNLNYDLVNQYGPWVATVSNKADMELYISAPQMAEYMMDRAKELYKAIGWETNWKDKPVSNKKIELNRILSILKDAGIEVVEK